MLSETKLNTNVKSNDKSLVRVNRAKELGNDITGTDHSSIIADKVAATPVRPFTAYTVKDCLAGTKFAKGA